MWLNIHYIWNPKIPENSKTSIYYAQDSLIWSSGNYLRAAGSGGKRDKTDRWGKGELSTVWGNNCMVNTAPVAESIPVQSSWQVGGGGGWWCFHTGCSASDWERGSAPPNLFSWFCGNIIGDKNHFRSLSIETQKYDCSKLDPKGGQTCGAAGISWLVCPKSFFGFFCRLGASPRNLVIATFKPPAWPNHKHNNSILQCLMKTLSNPHCPHR